MLLAKVDLQCLLLPAAFAQDFAFYAFLILPFGFFVAFVCFLRVCFRRDLAFASEILLFGSDSICRAYIFCKHFLKFFVEFYGGYDFGVRKPRLDKV